ncbi:MAG: glycosyltransferase family 4 protein [Acidimicrobiia bacterium]|nr:glycosyltransferase family 4 protein [Acidimicrobiia bacterium]
MIVANDVSSDTRVRKMAEDLADYGPKVTVLGFSYSGQREEFDLGRATVVRLPISEFRGSIRRGFLSRLRPATSPHILSRRIAGARDAFFLYQREVGARIGWMRIDFLDGRRRRFGSLNQKAALRSDRLADRRVSLEKAKTRVKQWGAPFRQTARVMLTLLIKLDHFITRSRTALVKYWVVGGQRVKQELIRRHESWIRARLRSREQRYSRSAVRWTNRMVRQADPDTDPRPGTVQWRQEMPELYDYDQTFSKEIETQAPDVVHAHDVHLLGVGARAVARRSVGGWETKLVYDSHEYVQGLSRYPKRTLAAWVDLEREYFHRADRVITVSPPLAELLQRDYQMSEPPVVVMNIPAVHEGGAESIREAAGLDSGVPLLVYSGGLDRTRGVHTLVAALAELDEVHLALVAKASSTYVQELVAMAEIGGYADRLHVVPFVEPNHVVSYLSSADVAVHPMVAGYMNHEIALPNKIFEYMHAGLPMIVSNCKAMSELVNELGIGESFESENAQSLAETARRVLDEIDRYREVYRTRHDLVEIYSWKGQREKLFGLYADLFAQMEPATSEAGPNRT